MRKLMVLALIVASAAVWGGPVAAAPPDTCYGDAVNDPRATDADDFLTGSADADVIALGVGEDQYFAAEGADKLCGNDGADVLAGEDGPDSINGGNGPDVLAGLQGADALNGSDGQDEVQGNAGDDVLRGGTGDGVPDDLYDGLGSDVVIGGAADTWHRCGDNTADDHSAFFGQIIPDPAC